MSPVFGSILQATADADYVADGVDDAVDDADAADYANAVDAADTNDAFGLLMLQMMLSC